MQLDEEDMKDLKEAIEIPVYAVTQGMLLSTALMAQDENHPTNCALIAQRHVDAYQAHGFTREEALTLYLTAVEKAMTQVQNAAGAQAVGASSE